MEKRLTVILNRNGSIDIIPEDVSQNPQIWISGTFLLLGFCVGTGLSLVTLLGLRIKSCHNSIIGLQLAALLDCVQGQVLGAVFLAVIPNDNLCRLSACMSTSLLVVETVEVMLLTFPPQGLQFGIIPWILGLLISLLIVVDYHSHVIFYPSRHSCLVVNGQHGWLSMVMIFILGTSWLGSATGIIYSCIFRQKDLDVTVSRIISILYVFLVLPTALILLVLISIKPYNENNHDIAESVFTWSRYQFNLLIPIVILIFYKEVRKESEITLCWYRNNSIGQSSRAINTNNPIHIVPKRSLRNRFPKKKSKLITPVLFATSNGLRLRTVDSNNQSTSTLSCEPCDLTESEVSTSKMELVQPEIEPKKNVRFASPIGCDIQLSESGIWSNTEDKPHVVEISTEKEPDTTHQLGVTYTKV